MKGHAASSVCSSCDAALDTSWYSLQWKVASGAFLRPPLNSMSKTLYRMVSSILCNYLVFTAHEIDFIFNVVLNYCI